MAAFIKFDGVDGESNSFYKLGDFKGKTPTKGGYMKIEWTYSSRGKLASMGMSQAGIEALVAGKPVQNEKDQEIVAGLVQKALS